MNFRKFFLTVGFSGLSPKAPGTVGSFVSLILGVILLEFLHTSSLFLLSILITIIAIKQIDLYEKEIGTHDSSEIVIDELAGMWIALAICGINSENVFILAPLAFIFFRIFDIWKPSIIGKIDRLRGGSGDDLLSGGNGIDTADYSDATEDLTVDINDGIHVISTSQGTDTFNSIEGVIGGSGNDKLTGNTKANTLIGNSGDDILDGAGTSTALSGEYDYLDGGDGKDSVSYKDFTSAVTINLGLTYGNSSDIHNFDATSVKVSLPSLPIKVLSLEFP
jgi:phosphatidylglycerophosphatase A